MSKIDSGQYNPEISNVAKETGGALDDIATNTGKVIGFAISEYDDIQVTYDGDNNITSVVYLKDSVTVATLTLEYSDGNLTRITKS